MKIELDPEQLRKKKLFIATPMYGGQCAGQYTKSLTDLTMVCTQNGIPIRSYFLFNESLITRARNYCVDEFLRSDYTHLLFIDSDIGFDFRDALTLLHLADSDNGYDIVTGPYPKKTIAWEKVQKAAAAGKGDEDPFELEKYAADFVFNPVKKQSSFNMGDPMEVGEAGTGFMLIPRATFEKFKEAYPELSYKPDHARTDNFDGSRDIHAFFDCIIDPVSRRYLSEDYFFCKKSREADMHVWMCPWMQLQHIGQYIFKGSLAHMGDLGVTATADGASSKKSYKKKGKK